MMVGRLYGVREHGHKQRVEVHNKQVSMLCLVVGRLRPFYSFSLLLSIAETGANDQIRVFFSQSFSESLMSITSVLPV